MEKGNLVRWLKKEGDKIKPGDVLAEIETDKATMEVEAVDEGVLAKIVVPEGTADVPVNDVIGLIAGEGEDAKSVSAAASSAEAETSQHRSRSPNRATSEPFGATARLVRLVNGQVAHASSPRRSRAGSPRNWGSILHRLEALVRTAVSSSAM